MTEASLLTFQSDSLPGVYQPWGVFSRMWNAV